MTEKPLEIPAVDARALQRERAAQLARYRASADAADALAELAAGNDSIGAAIDAALSGATLSELAFPSTGDNTTVAPIDARRGAVPFEKLRQATDAYAARTGARPRVFLANMGPLAQHKARADFSRGFLEVAAFEVIYNDGFDAVDAAADAALASQAPAVVICSTDKTYPDLVPPLTEKIKAASPEVAVFVAGYPADQVDAFKAAGVDDFIYMGANCLELLNNLQQKMGVIA